MARYKHIDTSPRFLAVDLQRQLIPGTLEHALNHLLDHEIDLSGFDAKYCNDLNRSAPGNERRSRQKECDKENGWREGGGPKQPNSQ